MKSLKGYKLYDKKLTHPCIDVISLKAIGS